MSWRQNDNPWSDENIYGPKSEFLQFLEDKHYGTFGIDRGTMGSFLGLQEFESKKQATNEAVDKPTVICTELRRQKLMSETDLRLSLADGKTRLKEETFRGYHLWAVPVVRIMRRSPRLTRFFRVLAQARVDEIAARKGEQARANMLGKLLILIGEPTCTLIGRCVRRPQSYQCLYEKSTKTTS